MTEIPGKGTNRFGFSVAARHVSEGAKAAIVKAAGTVDQLNHALHVITRIEQTPIKVAPRPVPSKEITPACKKFYDQLVAGGTADEVLNVARLSRYFRTHYAAAIKWAEKQKSQTPVNT